jgi:hypothetical protein
MDTTSNRVLDADIQRRETTVTAIGSSGTSIQYHCTIRSSMDDCYEVTSFKEYISIRCNHMILVGIFMRIC